MIHVAGKVRKSRKFAKYVVLPLYLERGNMVHFMDVQISQNVDSLKKKSNFEITLLFCFYLFYEKSHPKNNPSVNN